MKFYVGDFLLDDAPWLGRPVGVDSDQIETFTENNQHYITQEISNILKISKSINLLVKMKNVSFILQEKNIPSFWPTQYNVKMEEKMRVMWLIAKRYPDTL